MGEKGKAIKHKGGAPSLGLISTLLLLTLSGSAYRMLDKSFAGALNSTVFVNHLGYEKQLPQEWMTLIPSIIPAGQLIGSLSSGYILDAYGISSLPELPLSTSPKSKKRKRRIDFMSQK